jgi:hypothetical protein
MTKYAGREITIAVEDAATKTLATSAAADDIIDTTTPHGFAIGDAVVFETLTGGAGLTVGQVYIIIATSFAASSFMVSLLGPTGAPVNFTTDATAGTVRRFSKIGQVTTLGNPGSSRDLIDASAYGDLWKDYVVGQLDGSEMDLEFALDPADTGQDNVVVVYNAGVSKRYVMRHDLAAFAVSFPALMTKLERGGEREGLLVMACSLKVLNPGVVDVY